MRISKLCLVVCATALCASIPTLRADDNPNQAAARAALEQQMQSMNAQPAPSNAPAAAPAAPAQPAAAAASSTPPPATNPPAAATSTQAAPAAMAPAGTTAPAAAAPAAVPAASTATSSGNSLFSPVPPPSGGLPISAIYEQTTSTSTTPTAGQNQTPGTTQSLPMGAPANNNTANTSGNALGLKPIVAPPLPISADQQTQLRALLARYEAGAISPVEYQAERKKILNPPQ